ncbi:hypothetical protein GCM10011408_21420 [Dyella caseinilytica]|nr:hypothetical protein GCM10011408_21420 [Dyella caseinilytica]
MTSITAFRNLRAMTTWANRISELQALGMTYAEIAEETGLAPSTIGDLATGRSKSPRGEAALTLHLLHARKCGVVSQKPKRKRAA